MTDNPSVDRYLNDKAMDHIDHALGRPIWPLKETRRNYFATETDSGEAKAFDASPNWALSSVDGRMAYYSVTCAGRRALVDHLASLPDAEQFKAFVVSFKRQDTIIPALTAEAALEKVYNQVSEFWSELTRSRFYRSARVRLAA